MKSILMLRKILQYGKMTKDQLIKYHQFSLGSLSSDSSLTKEDIIYQLVFNEDPPNPTKIEKDIYHLENIIKGNCGKFYIDPPMYDCNKCQIKEICCTNVGKGTDFFLKKNVESAKTILIKCIIAKKYIEDIIKR